MRKSYQVVFVGCLLLSAFYGRANKEISVANPVLFAETSVKEIPAPPVALTAEEVTSDSFIARWGTSDSADSYQLDVSADDFTTLLQGYNNLIVNDTSVTVTNLEQGTTYYYRVRAVNEAGTSKNSNEMAVTTAAPPAPPVAVAAADVTPDSFIARWETSDSADGYRLDISVDRFTTLLEGYNNLAVDDTSVTVTNLEQGTTYYYRVRAVNEAGTSKNSNEMAVTTAAPPAPPVAVAAADVTPDSFIARWETSDSADSYRLDVSADDFTTLLEGYNNLVVNDTSYGVSNLSPGTSYQYLVRAVNSGGISKNSNAIEVETLPLIPSPPKATPATNVSKAGFIANWEAVSNAISYIVEVSTDNFNTLAAPISSGIVGTGAAISELLAGTVYQYRIKAVNKGGVSLPSNIILVTTLPSDPASLTAPVVTANGFIASWNPVASAIRYLIDISVDGFTSFVAGYHEKDVTDTSVTVTDLTPNVSYSLRVKAVNESGSSGYSDPISVTTQMAAPSVPQNLKVDPATHNSFTVTWDATPGADSYLVDVSTSATFAAGAFVTGFENRSVSPNSVEVSGLTPLTLYYFRVKAVNSEGESGYAEGNVTTLQAPPGVPQNLVASGTAQTSFTVSWDATPGADSYLVDVSTSATFAAGAFVTGFENRSVSANSIEVSGLTPLTLYYFRVKAINEEGDSGYAKGNVTTLQAPPGIPQNLVASGTAQTSFTVTWDATPGADSYLVDVSTSATFAAGAFVTGFENRSVSANSVEVSGLTPLTLYYFRVKAVNSEGDSGYADGNVTTLQAPPGVPQNLVASGTVQTSFTVSWDAAPGADSYLVDVSTSATFAAGAFVTGFENRSVSANSVEVSGLTPLTLYYFRVKAVNSEGESGYAEGNVTTLQAPPGIPQNLVASGTTQTSFSVTWDATPGADSYLVDVSTSDTFAAGTLVDGFDNRKVTTANIEVSGLTPLTLYYFRVKAINEEGESGYAEGNVTTLQAPPGIPQNLVASGTVQTSFTVSWDATPGADSYLVDVSTSDTFAAGTLVDGFDNREVTTRNIEVSGLTPFTFYYFRVKAVNEAGTSPASDTLAVRTAQVPAPKAPDNLKAIVVSQTEISLSWTDYSDNEEGFEIYRKGPLDEEYMLVATLEANVVSYTDNSLTSNTTYFYKVLAFNDGGPSGSSNSVSATTTQFPPTLNTIANKTILEDASVQKVVLSGITDGGEGGQVLTVSAVSDNPLLVPAPEIVYTSPAATAQLHYQPVANRSGVATVTVTVADNGQGQNTISESFEIVVTAVNDVPLFTLSQSTIEADEDFSPTKTISILPGFVPEDEKEQKVTYTLTPASVTFASVSIDPSTGVVSLSSRPGQSGTQTFTVTADDGELANNTASQNFTLTVHPVNDPPLFSVSGDIKVDENFSTNEIVTVTPAPVPPNETSQVVTYSLTPASVDFANVSIDAASGEVTITAKQNRSGGQEFTITANDGQTVNNIATAKFNLTVGAVNNAPSFTLGGDIKVNEDFTGIKTVMVTPDMVPDDEKDQVVTYSLSPPAVDFANVTIDKNSGLVEITARPDRYGEVDFQVIADDGQAVNNLATEEFTLTVMNINDAPTLNEIPDPATIFENAGEQTITLSGISPGPLEEDQTTLSILASSGNTTLIPEPGITYTSGSETATLTFTPNPNRSGTAEITVVIVDNGSNIAPHRNRVERKFTVTVSPVNKVPTLNPPVSPVTINEDPGDQVINISGITAGAGESQEIQISAVSDNPALISDIGVDYVSPENNGKIHFVPRENAWGTANIAITVTDDGPGEAPHANKVDQTVQVVVDPVNDPPTLDEIPDPPPVAVSAEAQEIPLGGISAGPGEQQDLSFTVTSTNVGLIPVPAITYNQGDGQGMLTFKPVAGKSGQAALTVTVEDDGPGTGVHINTFSRQFMVRVSNLPDLVLETEEVDVLYANPGQNLNVLASVKNQGIGNAAQSKLNFYLSSDQTFEQSDIQIGSSDIGPLQPGEESERNIDLNIPGALAEGTYFILYLVDDEENVEESNEDNNLTAVRLIVTSNTSPTITSVEIPEVTPASVWPVPARITLDDNGGIAMVRFFHRGITETEWMIDTIASNFNIYSFELDSLYYDEVGMEYYFEITDDGNIQINSKTGHSYIQYPGGIPLPPLTPGSTVADYQIIASPLELEDNSAAAFFEDDLGTYNKSQWRLFHYENGNAVEFKEGLNTIEPGKGYWLISKTGKTVGTGPGNTVRATKSKPFVLQLKKGWNQIGNPYNFNISWAEVLAGNGNPDNVGNLRVYEGGFVDSDRLGSFQGAFVFAEEDRELSVPVIQNKHINESGRMATGSSQAKEALWEVSFNLNTPSLSYNLGGLGMHPDAKTGKDPYDNITLPRFEMLPYLELNFAHPEYFASKFTRDITPELPGYTWEFSIDTDIKADNLTVHWSLKNKKNLKGQLLLFDVVSQQVINMATTDTYSYSLEGSRLFRVYYGSEDYIKTHLKPVRVSLGPGYPNPFSERVILPFTLPSSPAEAYHVEMVIFNQLGQHIKTIADRDFRAGFHSIDWNGTDEAGNRVSPGMYIYRMRINYQQEIFGRVLLR